MVHLWFVFCAACRVLKNSFTVSLLTPLTYFSQEEGGCSAASGDGDADHHSELHVVNVVCHWAGCRRQCIGVFAVIS